MSRVALIFGASGVSGWGTIVELLSYPDRSFWSRIIGLTNRPLSKSDAYFPDDERIELIPGVDLSQSTQHVVAALKDKVPNIQDVTHVFFYSYIHESEESQMVANTRLVKNALLALDDLSPKLEHFILQTGAKTYGSLLNVTPPYPWNEKFARSKDPRMLETMFYYGQVDFIEEQRKGKKWGWSQIIPDAIVGFAPTTNAMNIARSLAAYLFIYREVHGKGAEVPFPGSAGCYSYTNELSSMDSVARLSIWASLNPSITDGEAYNISEESTTWVERWPIITGLFGLKGIAPNPEPVDFIAFADQNTSAWKKLEKEHGLKGGLLEAEEKSGGWEFLDVMLRLIDHPRMYDNTARKTAGYTEVMDVIGGFVEALKKFAEAKLLPPLE